MNIFCSHNYELINQFEVKSEFDILVESGYKPTTWCGKTRIIVSDYKCTKCNKLKRFKVETPA